MTIKRCESCKHPKGDHNIGWIPLPANAGVFRIMPCGLCACRKYKYDFDRDSVMAFEFTYVIEGNNAVIYLNGTAPFQKVNK